MPRRPPHPSHSSGLCARQGRPAWHGYKAILSAARGCVEPRGQYCWYRRGQGDWPAQVVSIYNRHRIMGNRGGAAMSHVFIKGSSDGLGLLAAKLLILQGHQVVVHGPCHRSGDRGRSGRHRRPFPPSCGCHPPNNGSGINAQECRRRRTDYRASSPPIRRHRS
jgi:hypothetical protein